MAYDFNLLVTKLKARGLDLTEELAVGVTTDVFSFVEESIKLSPTPLDDILLIILPVLKTSLLKIEDTIDGQVG